MKDSSGNVKEIFVLRSLACLGIVFYNTISTTIAHFFLEENHARACELQMLYIVQLLLMFSTPMFVFISEFLLAKSYGDRLPAGFLKRRAKYILVPYVSIAVFYTLMQVLLQDSAITFAGYAYELAKNLFLADFFGYFLLVIFQFYVLHALFLKYVYGKIRMPYAIGAAIAVNVLYLAPFNFFDLSASLNINFYLVSFMNKVPFTAWIAYFTIVFYCGRNYDRVIAFLRKNSLWVYAVTMASAGMLLYMYDSGTIEHVYSKRVDVMFYTIGVFFTLLYLSSKWRKVPAVLMRINQYSFSIFLLSRFVLAAISAVLPVYENIAYIYLFFFVSAAIAIIGSIVISHLLNKFEFGPLLVGKIGIGPPKRKRRQDGVQLSVTGAPTNR